MRQGRRFFVLILGIFAGCAKSPADHPATPGSPIQQIRPGEGPPRAATKPHTVESKNGNRDDPYYWLRDDSRENSEMLAYLTAENAYRDQVLAPNQQLENEIYDELVGRIVPTDTSVPVLDRGYWYYHRFEAAKERPIYARRKGSMEAPEEIIVDANVNAQGHDFYHVGEYSVSDSGRYVVYTDDTVGRRQYTLHIKDMTTNELLPDTAANIEEDVAWVDDKTLLYIEQDPETLLGGRVHKHVLGGTGDPVVYEEQDHAFYMHLARSKSTAFVFIDLSSTTTSEWLYANVKDAKLRFKAVIPRTPNHEYQVEHVGRDFIIRTNSNGASNFRIVHVPIAKSAQLSAWKDIVSPRKDVFVGDFEVSNEALAVSIRQDGLLKLLIKPLDPHAQFTTVTGDSAAYTMTLVSTPDIKRNVFRYEVSTMVTPTTTYEIDVKDGTKHELKVDEVPGYDATQYATEYLQATARDGTSIPVSVAYRKDTPRDGNEPLFQYGYGAYGVSSDPDFEADWVSLMNRGFVVAIAHVRGGQELGRAWYDNGRLLAKKNTFTDFIDVTHGLVQHGYGGQGKVVAEGASAGGLLMGAIANMGASDYRAICAYVPFVDVVTTMLDTTIPLTTNEFDEWGNPQDPQFYDYLLSYSPYDNVRAQAYPAMLVFTGLWDSQVQYYEPTKWVAKLRATKTDNHPLVLSVDMSSGHGGKSGRFERKRNRAREYAFFVSQLLGPNR